MIKNNQSYTYESLESVVRDCFSLGIDHRLRSGKVRLTGRDSVHTVL